MTGALRHRDHHQAGHSDQSQKRVACTQEAEIPEPAAPLETREGLAGLRGKETYHLLAVPLKTADSHPMAERQASDTQAMPVG